ncbi:ankyrin repeat domain-containing protein [Armatimonas rosea]|uniref:Ankyrin repeat protein n=1 Tax=Armatimonas rosea TaxID=685828 RepID=A0A7W9STF7_ARMRO|nr:ankyrin repeat domain-containing protein [Armatimonas rosea]MBB6051998.1 ankyrin repeat protein [Armatimonas rosea]
MQGYRSPGPPKTLLDAAASGNLTAVQKFLAQGAKPDQRDTNGWTALHHAVGYGQEPEIHSPTGRAPVKGIVEALLKAGTPLNSQTKAGMTPLMQAVIAEHEEAAQWLLAAGADLRPADTVGGTALTHALWYNHCSRALAQRLLQRGSPVNLWDALWLGDTSKALGLVEIANVKATGPNNYTYLHLAAELGNLPVVQSLLARGAIVNARDNQGFTPLHHAIGGKPGHVVLSGRPYWHAYGPIAGREPLLALLLKSGANRDARGHDAVLPQDYTALGCAILAQRPELMQVLLRAGANPNEKGYHDDPQLFAAIETQSPTVVKMLLDAGADPRRKSAYGTTVLEAAKSTENQQILALVKAALQKPLH